MKESVGYTVTLNIMIVFITIIIVFLSSALVYFKSNKVSNIITSTIEKYEGYNSSSINEIKVQLTSIGYSSRAINCSETIEDAGAKKVKALDNTATINEDGYCSLILDNSGRGINGYCVYLCMENVDYYYYKIRTNMMINVPIVNNLLNIPIYSNTNRLYNFSGTIDGKEYKR